MIIVQNFDDFNDVMAKIGFGKANVFIIFTCGLFNMYLLTETMGMSVISPAAMCDFGLDTFQRSLLRSSSLAGLAFGGYFMGYLSDQYGRRKIMLYSTPLCLFISNASWFVNVWEMLGILRLLLGITLGGVASSTMAYLGEFCMNQKCLIRNVSIMAIFAGFGMIYIPAIGSVLFNQSKVEFSTWRLLGILYTLPGIAAFFFLLILPESPRYLLSAGRQNDTLNALHWLSVKNRGLTLDEIGISDISHLVAQIEHDDKHWLLHLFCDALPLFKSPLVQKFMGSFLIHFFVVCVSRGLGLWFTEMRITKVESESDASICRDIILYLQKGGPKELNCVFPILTDSLILGTAFVLGCLAIAFMLKYVKPKVLFVSGLMASSICGFILTWVPNMLAIDVSFILFLGFSNMVMNLLGSSIVAFAPTNLRGRAMGLCDASGRVGAILACIILGIYLDYKCKLIFNVLAACPMVAAILGCFLPF